MNAAAPSCRVATTRMPALIERIEQAEERLARDRERIPDARGAELVGDVAADRPRPGLDGRFGFGRGFGGFGDRSGRGRRVGLGHRFG